MRYTVYIIDNDIPASLPEAQRFGILDTSMLNAANLRLLLGEVTWRDEVVKTLTSTLLGEMEIDGVTPKWDVFGFTSPFFCLNAIDDGTFRADLVVFDWEYPGTQTGSATNSENALRQLLEKTFCLVFVFSGADKKEEIAAVLAKAEFEKYKERLYPLDKIAESSDQSALLLYTANEMYKSNFSFKFAQMLRKRSVQCADQILSEMGKASLNDVRNLLGVEETGGKKEFIDFLAERFRASLASASIYALIDEMTVAEGKTGTGNEDPDAHEDMALPGDGDTATDSTSIVSSVWSYRLYFRQDTGDDLLRRGDIVQVGDKYIMICSADCDLSRHWLKNLGIINGICLYPLEQSNASLTDWLARCLPKKLSKSTPKSLLDNFGDLSDGPFILPFVPLENSLRSFVAIPRDVLSEKIAPPSGWETMTRQQKMDHSMRYEYWPGAKRICTIAEPFLTPAIQHVLNTIGGVGVPDYPSAMKSILEKILEDFRSNGPVGAPVAAVQAAHIPPPAVTA
jgi:hypothetical protein